ncbi:MAG: ATP-binding cassette domain-containing protein [Acidobacteriota bacterium]|nr:ATP-binding cassette domain-containing protein [Acidobacteriota bacterium]
MIARARTPLPWLGALLAIYLGAPIAAFLVRLGHGVSAPPGLAAALLTSLLTATIATALIALTGIPLAYLLARWRGPIAAGASVLVALPLALPPLMSGILLLYLVGPNTLLGHIFGGTLTNTRTGIVIAQTFVAAPFLVIAARGSFASVDDELEEVARTLGHRRVARFLRVALPVAWPGVQAGLLLAWLRSFGEFGATVILAYHPYSLPVFTFVQFDSTGLGGTMLPVGAALGAALVVLVAVQAHARRRRPRASLPQPRAPHGRPSGPLRLSLHKALGPFVLSLDHAGQGTRLAMLGPSGAGKTLTLRLIAGLCDGDEAGAWSGEDELSGRPAEERSIGYLPQRSALMPRRTVWQQVNFAVDADPALAAWWLERLGLDGLQDRFPEELSGGQQRRVALARALAREPGLVLLDEPFSALDVPVRRRLWRELRRLGRETGLATVLVTHDPEEASLLADEVIVLHDGSAIQQGSVAEVFGQPASLQVAELTGMENVAGARVIDSGRIDVGGVALVVTTDGLASGQQVLWAVRPEDVVPSPAGRYTGHVLDTVALGPVSELTVALGSAELKIRGGGSTGLAPGEACKLDIPPHAIRVWRGAGDGEQPVRPPMSYPPM